MAFHLRPAKPDDFSELYAVDQSCFSQGIAWSKAELAYFLRYPGNFAIVVEEDGVPGIAGFAIAGLQRKRGLMFGRLITIDVRAHTRQRGVGQMLMSAIEEHLRGADAEAIQLEVAVNNAVAQEFYGHRGFVRTGRIPGYYQGRLDAYVMEKRLKAKSAARLQ
ncbi:MAG TPA: N-acetyltransferase [Acidobacteriaceae bacterium]|nr:N-acetyltransferase [Acidobacteriaceae bacterium]